MWHQSVTGLYMCYHCSDSYFSDTVHNLDDCWAPTGGKNNMTRPRGNIKSNHRNWLDEVSQIFFLVAEKRVQALRDQSDVVWQSLLVKAAHERFIIAPSFVEGSKGRPSKMSLPQGKLSGYSRASIFILQGHYIHISQFECMS